MVASHTWPAPDVVVVALLGLALLTAQGLEFLRDWTPFLALLLAYVALPGLFPGLEQRVHAGFPVAVDQWLGRGTLPTLRLQHWLWDPHHRHVYDYLVAALYLLHFITPLVVAYLLWRWQRAIYWRFVQAYVLLFTAGFVTYIVYPMAPPWWASATGRIATVQPILSSVHWQGLGNPVVLLSRFFRTDPVAAMPSMHAAWPVLVWLVAWRLSPRWGWLAVVYPVAMAFAVIYAGEHYLIDVLAGWIYAGAAFGVVWFVWPWYRQTRIRSAAGPACRSACEGREENRRAGTAPLQAATLRPPSRQRDRS